MTTAPRPWTVYTCSFADADTGGQAACGLNGRSYDCSTDECHHPLARKDAILMALAPELLAALERIVNEIAAYRSPTLSALAAALALIRRAHGEA